MLTWLAAGLGITAVLHMETVLSSICLPGRGGGHEEEMQHREGRLAAAMFLWPSHFIFSSSYLHMFLLLMFFSKLFSLLSFTRL